MTRTAEKQLTITRSSEYGRILHVDGDEPMDLLVDYTGPSNTFKAVALDNQVMPLLASATDLLEALEETLEALDAFTNLHDDEAVKERARTVIDKAKRQERRDGQ